MGGFTEGAVQAGVEVVWAANHWRVAVDTHAANHPRTRHACQDLHQANWLEVPPHDLLLASPCCQGHSRARGKSANNPQHDASRSTAWAVVSAAECHRPWGLVAENVPEFLDWALYPAWSAALAALGYTLTHYVIDAADHGVPQHRVRLFIVGTRTKKPVQLRFEKREHVPIASVLDWSHKTSPIDKPGRAAATLARIARGRERFGDRFLAPFYGSGSGLTGRSIHRPIGTITTLDRWAVVDGDRMRILQKDEVRAAMGFPAHYQLPQQHKLAVHMLGNAVSPIVARDVIQALRAAA